MNSAIVTDFVKLYLIKIKLKQLDMSTIISRPEFKAKYDNYIGEIRSSVNGEYFDVICPIDGKYLRRRLILAKKM
jgi:hypothetical protein